MLVFQDSSGVVAKFQQQRVSLTKAVISTERFPITAMASFSSLIPSLNRGTRSIPASFSRILSCPQKRT